MSATTARAPEKVIYTAEATSTGDGRSGHVRTSDGRLDLDLAIPGPGGDTSKGTNPEQLFASGYAGCFHSALRFSAQKAGIDPGESTVTAAVDLGPESDGFGIAVRLRIEVPGLEREQAQSLVDAAHHICPYSRATRGNITASSSSRRRRPARPYGSSRSLPVVARDSRSSCACRACSSG